MEHVLTELARDRQRSLLAAAAGGRNAYRARQHSRRSRLAERAQRRQLRYEAARLRAELREFETTSEPEYSRSGR
jgi:hypothetical protein